MKLKLLTLTILFFIKSNSINAQNTNTGTEAGNAGINNSAFGYYAGNLVTGKNNSFVGYFAGQANAYVLNNAFFGANSGANNIGDDNVFVGYNSGYNNLGAGNVFIGSFSGYNNLSGVENIFIGKNTGIQNTSGYKNVFVGHNSGNLNINGVENAFFGYQTGFMNTSGKYNVLNGTSAGKNSNGSNNAFYGYKSGYENTIGSANTYIGFKSGYHSTGSNNVFVGLHAGYWETQNNRLYIDSAEDFNAARIPLIYGKFDTDQLGINTNVIPTGYTMAVKGKFITEEVKVQTYASWPDFVFKKEYKLPTLIEVEQHIKEKGHLQNIPSASEVSENGILLGEMNAKLLQKIEELTLYIIQQEKRFDNQEARLKKLEAEMPCK